MGMPETPNFDIFHFNESKCSALGWGCRLQMLLRSEMQSQAVLSPGRCEWCLLDHGVHGRDALGHDQGLAVGDVVEGRARVTGQNHLGGRFQER